MAEHRKLVATWQIGPYPVDVYEYSAPIEEGDPDGQLDTSVRPREIRYHARCTGLERWAVIVHELTHLSLKLMSIDLGNKEEIVCDAVGMTMIEALKSFLSDPPSSQESGRPSRS